MASNPESNPWHDVDAGDEIEDAIDMWALHPGRPLHRWHPLRRAPGTPRKGRRYSRDIREAIGLLDLFTAYKTGFFQITCDKSSHPWFSCVLSGGDEGDYFENYGYADTAELAAIRAILHGRPRDSITPLGAEARDAES